MKKRFLQNNPLFAVLSEEERQAIADRFALCHFAAEEALFREGEPARAMYLIKSGLVHVREGETLRGRSGPSHLVGERALFLDHPHLSSAVAQGAVDAWALERAGLSEVMAAFPKMSIKLTAMLGERLPEVDRYLVGRLEETALFKGMEPQALGALAAALLLREVQSGALIFQSGTHADRFYLLESGTVTLISTAPGEPEPFQQVGPGELFGHEALLRGRAYGAVARAATPVQLWVLDRDGFERVALRFPALRRAMAAAWNEQGLPPADRAVARQAMAQMPLFRELPEPLLEELVGRLLLRHVGEGERLFEPGDPGDAFFVVDQGAIELWDGETLLAEHGPGAFFGEHALLTGAPRGERALAARSSNLWLLPKRDWDAAAAQNPLLARVASSALQGEEGGDALPPLTRFPLFSGLTPAEQAEVAGRLSRLPLQPEEILFREGAAPDAFYLLEAGQIRLQRDGTAFETVRPGGFFGEMALLTGSAHTVTARAIEVSEVLMLERGAFEAMLNRYPSVSLVLSRALSGRLQRASHAADSAELPPRSASPEPAEPRAIPRPRAAARARDTAHSRGARLRFALVLALLLWLVGVTAPTLLLTDAAYNDASPLRPLLTLSD